MGLIVGRLLVWLVLVLSALVPWLLEFVAEVVDLLGVVVLAVYSFVLALE